jgi:alpha-amylase
MAVMMQAFYWDAPIKEQKEGEWWNYLSEKTPELAAAGISALWVPPICKGAEARSPGYDPYDYFDLGDFDQRGATKTLYGNRKELESLIGKLHEHKIGAYADMVINHNSGADEEEVNPIDGQKRWTKFNPKSGKFPRDWNCFHPSRYERVMIEGENFAGFPHLCHRNPRVYEAMFEYARMVIEELGFDGFRFDFAKGYGAWMIGLLAKYRYERDGKEFTPFVVGEYWSGPEDIGDWLDGVRAVTDNQIAAFDFPLRYKLKDLCDTPGYDLRNLTADGSVVSKRPFNAVTFVENHDMGGNEIVNDKNLPGIPIGALSPLVGSRPFRRPPSTGFFAAEFTFNRFSAAMKDAFAGRSDDSTFQLNNDRNHGNTLLLPNRNLDFAHAKLDFNAVVTATSRITLFTQLDNLLGQQHIGPIGYPGLPFTIRAGMKFRIGGD